MLFDLSILWEDSHVESFVCIRRFSILTVNLGIGGGLFGLDISSMSGVLAVRISLSPLTAYVFNFVEPTLQTRV